MALWYLVFIIHILKVGNTEVERIPSPNPKTNEQNHQARISQKYTPKRVRQKTQDSRLKQNNLIGGGGGRYMCFYARKVTWEQLAVCHSGAMAGHRNQVNPTCWKRDPNELMQIAALVQGGFEPLLREPRPRRHLRHAANASAFKSSSRHDMGLNGGQRTELKQKHRRHPCLPRPSEVLGKGRRTAATNLPLLINIHRQAGRPATARTV